MRGQLRVITTSGGHPRTYGLNPDIRDSGMLHFHAVSNVRQARVAEGQGVDAVIATGYEAAGHVGHQGVHTFVLVPAIAEAVDIPVVCAGGVVDGRALAGALALGAELGYIGTRFLAAAECDYHDNMKQYIVGRAETDTEVIPAFFGPARFLRNPTTTQVYELDRAGTPAHRPDEDRGGGADPRRHRGRCRARADDRGPGAGRITEVLGAADIVARIVAETEEALDRISEFHHEASRATMTHQVTTYCRICPGLCGIVVDVDDDDRILKVSGDPEHPISAGYTCSKGRALPAYHHHPDRLDRPQLRGVDVTWDEALDDLAGRLTELVERHGPDTVAIYRATHSAFDGAAQRTIGSFLRGLGTNQRYSSITLDTPNKNLVPDLVAGSGYLFPLADWDATRLLLLIGHNPVVSHGHVTTRPNGLATIRAIKARGGKVVVVDPRRTESARLADLHLAPRPGTDAALLAFLVRSILAGGVDEAYVEANVDPDSMDRLRVAVAPFDRDTTAERCDLPSDDLDRLVEMVRDAGRVSTQTGTGVSMSSAPNVAEWLVWALGAVTGSLDRPGGILFNPGVLRQQDNGPLTRPWPSGPSPASRPELRHAYGEMPSVALGDEVRAGNVRALIVVGGNPAVVFPDAEATREMLTSVDVLAVLDVQHTETTALATHLLPVASQLERADLPVFLDAVLSGAVHAVRPAGRAPGRRPPSYVVGVRPPVERNGPASPRWRGGAARPAGRHRGRRHDPGAVRVACPDPVGHDP